MLYCFLREELEMASDDHSLIIQKEYAQKLGALLIASLTEKSISGLGTDSMEQKAMLRCTCDNLFDGFRLLRSFGVNLIETETEVETIENWHTLNLTHRKILEIGLSDLQSVTTSADLLELLHDSDRVFLKSKKKGFSATISTLRLLRRDPEVLRFLKNQCDKYGQHMLISKSFSLKADSLGSRESRHFIMSDHLVNSSRPLHHIRHTVPKSHIIKARTIAKQIAELRSFPPNYVLDLGEFTDDDRCPCLDVVELNPISCSLCYVNNSIFETTVPEIERYGNSLLMGYEYCYDAIKNPQDYLQERASNKNYTYKAEERYVFL